MVELPTLTEGSNQVLYPIPNSNTMLVLESTNTMLVDNDTMSGVKPIDSHSPAALAVFDYLFEIGRRHPNLPYSLMKYPIEANVSNRNILDIPVKQLMRINGLSFNHGHKKWGREAEAFIEECGYKKATLIIYGSIYTCVKVSNRFDTLSHKHHCLVAPMETATEQNKWLKKALIDECGYKKSSLARYGNIYTCVKDGIRIPTLDFNSVGVIR